MKMEVVKIALVISTLSSLKYMKEAVSLSSDVHPHICISQCVEKFSTGSPDHGTVVQRIFQQSAPSQALQIERLVVVLYKVNGKIQIYIPNAQRQKVLPDLQIEETDFLQPVHSRYLNELFSRSPYLVIEPFVSIHKNVSQKYNASSRNLDSQQGYMDKQRLLPIENYQTVQNPDSNMYSRTSPSKISRYIPAVEASLGKREMPKNYFSHFHSNTIPIVSPNQYPPESNEVLRASTNSESDSIENMNQSPDYLRVPQRQLFNFNLNPTQTSADWNLRKYWNNHLNRNMQQDYSIQEKANFMHFLNHKRWVPYSRSHSYLRHDHKLHDSTAPIKGQNSSDDLLTLQQSQYNRYPQRPPGINYNVEPPQSTLVSEAMCANDLPEPIVNDNALFNDWFIRQVWQLGPATISNLLAFRQNTQNLLRKNRLLLTKGCVIDGNHQKYPIQQLVLRRLIIYEKPSNSVFKHQWYLLTLGTTPSLIGLIPTDPSNTVKDPEEKHNLMKVLSEIDLTHDENEAEYRIVGGKAATGSGAPLNNKGRSGIIA